MHSAHKRAPKGTIEGWIVWKWRWRMCKTEQRIKNMNGWVCVQALGKNYAHKIGVEQMHDISTLTHTHSPREEKKKQENTKY